MQQFVVGAGPETFRYLEIIEKKTKDQSHFFTMPVHLIFVTKFTYNGTCPLQSNSFRSGHEVHMVQQVSDTGWCQNIVIGAVKIRL